MGEKTIISVHPHPPGVLRTFGFKNFNVKKRQNFGKAKWLKVLIKLAFKLKLAEGESIKGFQFQGPAELRMYSRISIWVEKFPISNFLPTGFSKKRKNQDFSKALFSNQGP